MITIGVLSSFLQSLYLKNERTGEFLFRTNFLSLLHVHMQHKREKYILCSCAQTRETLLRFCESRCLRKVALIKDHLLWDLFYILIRWKLYLLQGIKSQSAQNEENSLSYQILKIDIPGSVILAKEPRTFFYP